MKQTLVIGSSLNPSRYSNLAIHRLVQNNIEVKAIGLRVGEVAGVSITKEKESFRAIHTITLYLNAIRQEEYYAYIISLQPKRIIFNPGTENDAFYPILEENGIAYEEACTLVLLGTNQY
jgi:predicted CoA-binding protein